MLYVDFKNNQMAIDRDVVITQTPNFAVVEPIHTKYGILVSVLLPEALQRGGLFYNESLEDGFWELNSFMVRENEIVVIRHYKRIDGIDYYRGAYVRKDEGYPCLMADRGFLDVITSLFDQELLEKDEDGDYVFYERFLGKEVKATLYNILEALDYRALRNRRGRTEYYNLQEELKKCNDGKPLEPMDNFYIELIKLSKSVTSLNTSLSAEVEEKPVYRLKLD